MKSLILTILLTFCLNTFSKGNKPSLSKEEKRWSKIERLINQEMKTIQMARKKSDKLMYRMFELKSEKLKLIKEKENKSFMENKLKYGKKIKRENSFKKTLKEYHKTNNYGLSILKKYPKSRYKAAIYYTLALNSRDFAYDKKELNYLQKAIKLSRGNSQINYLARTSLAEYYYNNKKWDKAVYQYKIIIKNNDDEWYTKNLLNYGWCLLKKQKFAKAIRSLEKSYILSKDDFYVDVKDQAMTGLVSFYVLGNEIDRGVSFIDKHSTNKNESHFKLAKKASAKGNYKETLSIINLLTNRISDKNETELFADFHLFQFDFYNQYHKQDKLMSTATKLSLITLNDYQKEDAIRKVSDVVGAKQVILKKDYSKHNQEFDSEVLSQIEHYFSILAKINSQEKAQYQYYLAETYYSIELYKKALNEYKVSLVSFESSPSKNDLRAKNLDAIFSCIDIINFNKKDKNIELLFAFNKYLEFWPKDKKAQKIYPRLFNIHRENKDYRAMQESLDRYISNFKDDHKTQKSLFTIQMDMMIKEKNTKLLSSNITKLQKGYLNFTKEEIKKSETILANILFESFKDLKIKGKDQDALQGYQKVFFTEYYPKSIKGEAAFNIGMLYTDLQDNNNAFKWYRKSFKFLTKKEITKKRSFLEKMALRTALLQNLQGASKIEKFILRTFCKDKKKNFNNFSNAIKYDLANNYIRKVNYTFKKYSKCTNQPLKTLKKEVLTHLFDNKDYRNLNSFIKRHKLKGTFTEQLAAYYEDLFWSHVNLKEFKSNKYYTLLMELKTAESNLLKEALHSYTKLKSDIQGIINKRIIIKKENPNPNNFISALTKRMNDIKLLNERANKILEMGHGQVSVLTYDLIIHLGNSFSTEVMSYHIPINDKNFQNQFKSEMFKISRNINKETDFLKKQSQSLIEKYELLVSMQDQSHSAHKILTITDIRPDISNMAVTFGRGK